MTKEEEMRLIQAVLAGDTGQFEPLVKAYEKTIYNLALRMLGDPQDALDASQEAFFRAYRALPSFRGESKFSVWLYRLASNVCLDMLRKRSQTQEVPLADEAGQEQPIPDARFCPQTELEKKELRRMVHRGLNQLSPSFRQALVLREINGLSYEEIAAVTGLEPGTVKSRIFRARKKLAAILMEDGNFLSLSSSLSSTELSLGKGGDRHEQ
jgi:RNA polymerase sigma-70 factor (ECF subfamily)